MAAPSSSPTPKLPLSAPSTPIPKPTVKGKEPDLVTQDAAYFGALVDLVNDINGHILNPAYRVQRGAHAKRQLPAFLRILCTKVNQLYRHVKRHDPRLTKTLAVFAEIFKRIDTVCSPMTGEEGYVGIENELYEIKKLLGMIIGFYATYVWEDFGSFEMDELVEALRRTNPFLAPLFEEVKFEA